MSGRSPGCHSVHQQQESSVPQQVWKMYVNVGWIFLVTTEAKMFIFFVVSQKQFYMYVLCSVILFLKQWFFLIYKHLPHDCLMWLKIEIDYMNIIIWYEHLFCLAAHRWICIQIPSASHVSESSSTFSSLSNVKALYNIYIYIMKCLLSVKHKLFLCREGEIYDDVDHSNGEFSLTHVQ